LMRAPCARSERGVFALLAGLACAHVAISTSATSAAVSRLRCGARAAIARF